ncbi:hypothetical protein [Neobacillus niacini]|jgi:hypothetical protein|uniref:hypothetical protein n=1 Tax=Neobacillus niacini TaxID=86668 RepID=UPI001C8F1415|nr:hypothetical protein [Neobacillus niacini]MBY0147408.1 hypothetical protein [Neobacillus niacini]
MASLDKIKLFKLISILFTKLAGAGFTLLLFFTFLFLQSEWDMVEFVDTISSEYIWIIIFGYGIFCSILIDIIEWKIARINKTLKILLYIVAGYAFFFINGINVINFIAGTIGALCALIFYFGTYLTDRSKGRKLVFAFLVPLFFILLMNINFTEKKQWDEERKATSYTASFEYFNGKHEIPIKVNEGQIINISIDFKNQNGGGYGYHVLNPKGDLVGMTEAEEREMTFTAHESGVYHVVVTGDDLQGGITVKWTIDETK